MIEEKAKPKQYYRFWVLPGRWLRVRYDRLALLALLDRWVLQAGGAGLPGGFTNELVSRLGGFDPLSRKHVDSVPDFLPHRGRGIGDGNPYPTCSLMTLEYSLNEMPFNHASDLI